MTNLQKQQAARLAQSLEKLVPIAHSLLPDLTTGRESAFTPQQIEHSTEAAYHLCAAHERMRRLVNLTLADDLEETAFEIMGVTK